MMSEVEERPRLVTTGYGRHGSQWVNSDNIRTVKQIDISFLCDCPVIDHKFCHHNVKVP